MKSLEISQRVIRSRKSNERQKNSEKKNCKKTNDDIQRHYTKNEKKKKKKLKTKKPHQIYNQKSPQNTEGDTMCFSKVDLFH
jgi:hypothetical protein